MAQIPLTLPSLPSGLSSGLPVGLSGGLSGGAALQGARATALTPKDKAAATAQDFEAVFLNSMFQEMFTSVGGEGPFGGAGPGGGVWRSFLSEEYAKSFAKSGGVGLGAEVYRALLVQQEARAP